MIQVGEVLDKYELLERVGQGGMAVVYRGLDRSLKRVVAVKILHKHLSDYQEARDRFEREAQAVAKLRHENILEIFDYSGHDPTQAKSGSSYIVTEFIDGQTLKQAITERPIQYPEIGAMIILQVCRALAHAHGAGILHRDVKPENVMIRSDGVVKLMDFGISHMLDLERLTVTGQLLGSPAYMAPEHVEGRQLDFRTDVFAAGIVLYQLTVGKLPFEGKNPHEVLKRIAECKFTDPRQANPVIGNRLGRIILKAMAADPNDRYANVGEMTLALEAYLEESGVDVEKVQSELARYFAGPAAYEQAFEIKLLDHLTARGTKLLAANDRAPALDIFDRILTIDPENEKVLAILDGINRRRRLQQTALGVGAVCVIAFCAFMVHRKNQPEDAETIAAPTGSEYVWNTRMFREVVKDQVMEPPPELDAGVAEDALVASREDARDPTTPVDAGLSDTAPAVVQFELTVKTFPRDAVVTFGDAPPVTASNGTAKQQVAGDVLIKVSHPQCETREQLVKANAGDVQINLIYKSAQIIPKCAAPGAIVRVDGKPARVGQGASVFWGDSTVDSKRVDVEFVIDGRPTVTKPVTVAPAQRGVVVTCE